MRRGLPLTALTALAVSSPPLAQAQDSASADPALHMAVGSAAELARPALEEAVPIWRDAVRAPGERIIISLGERRLWLLDGDTTLLSAPVAVGKGNTFAYGARSWTFDTPRGRHSVLGKAEDPLWVPPDWHYLEKAVEDGLDPVFMEKGRAYELRDGTTIEIRGDQVGRVNRYRNFWPFTPGAEIVFDGRIFIPPFGTAQRKIPDGLGTRKLVLGDGYLIHGTYDEDSIGERASHGCVRLTNAAVERLYEMVEEGTPVFIY